MLHLMLVDDLILLCRANPNEVKNLKIAWLSMNNRVNE